MNIQQMSERKAASGHIQFWHDLTTSGCPFATALPRLMLKVSSHSFTDGKLQIVQRFGTMFFLKQMTDKQTAKHNLYGSCKYKCSSFAWFLLRSIVRFWLCRGCHDSVVNNLLCFMFLQLFGRGGGGGVPLCAMAISIVKFALQVVMCYFIPPPPPPPPPPHLFSFSSSIDLKWKGAIKS